MKTRSNIPVVDLRAGYVLKRLQLTLRASMERALSKHKITTPQYAVLAFLELSPKSSNADLARRAFVTPQTMIRILDNLERDGFVARAPHPSRPRVVQLSLAARGRRTVASCHQAVMAVEKRMLSRMPESQHARFVTMLESCAAALAAELPEKERFG